MIIGVSGKIGSGKDLTGMIIQALTNKPTAFDNMTHVSEEEVRYKVWDVPKFKTRKFADKLKDFVCSILGCTREQLEDREFKEKELGPEWWYYKVGKSMFAYRGEEELVKHHVDAVITKLTPRLLLQLMGTECGRQILHPNIWVNAVMSEYNDRYYGLAIMDAQSGKIAAENSVEESNWVITDMRFPNESAAVQERGITIRVNRPKYKGEGEENYEFESGTGRHVWYDNKELGHVSFATNAAISKEAALAIHRENVNKGKHASETALDDAEFDYTVVNDGSILDLVMKIKLILIKEKVICLK